jgi:hypothetical protein
MLTGTLTRFSVNRAAGLFLLMGLPAGPEDDRRKKESAG